MKEVIISMVHLYPRESIQGKLHKSTSWAAGFDTLFISTSLWMLLWMVWIKASFPWHPPVLKVVGCPCQHSCHGPASPCQPQGRFKPTPHHTPQSSQQAQLVRSLWGSWLGKEECIIHFLSARKISFINIKNVG